MFVLATYQGLLAAVDAAVTAKDKGDAFEKVCRYLFAELDGVIIEGSDVDMAAKQRHSPAYTEYNPVERFWDIIYPKSDLL